MWNDLAALIILPTGFYIGSHWGTQGIAWGWVAAYPLVALPLYWKTFKTIEMPVGDYLRALRPALQGTAVMVLAVTLLKWALAAETFPVATDPRNCNWCGGVCYNFAASAPRTHDDILARRAKLSPGPGAGSLKTLSFALEPTQEFLLSVEHLFGLVAQF